MPGGNRRRQGSVQDTVSSGEAGRRSQSAHGGPATQAAGAGSAGLGWAWLQPLPVAEGRRRLGRYVAVLALVYTLVLIGAVLIMALIGFDESSLPESVVGDGLDSAARAAAVFILAMMIGAFMAPFALLAGWVFYRRRMEIWPVMIWVALLLIAGGLTIVMIAVLLEGNVPLERVMVGGGLVGITGTIWAAWRFLAPIGHDGTPLRPQDTNPDDPGLA